MGFPQDGLLDEAGPGRRWFAPRIAAGPAAVRALPPSAAESPPPGFLSPGSLRALASALAAHRRQRRLCRRNAALAARNVERRRAAAQAELDRTADGYVFLAGDSHAELLGHPAWDGGTVVNGGIGGRSARHYAVDLPRLAFRRRAAVAVLSVGTNDIMCRSKPLSPRAEALFEAAIGTILAHLRVRADRVVVLAVPPVGPPGAFPREPRAVEPYSRRLARAAARRGCLYLDPFAAIRSRDFGVARPGALGDEVHLADYRPVWAQTHAFLRADPSGAL